MVDERTLRENYLTAFEIVVRESHPKSIMSSYNLINGAYANEDRRLLRDILRGEWGFGGAVVTDWGGSNDHAAGVEAGSTFEMPVPGMDSIRQLVAAVYAGRLPEEVLDGRVDDALELALFTRPAVEGAAGGFDEAARHALARQAAARRVADSSGKPNPNVLLVWNMPLRAPAKMTDGVDSMGMVDAIVREIRGGALRESCPRCSSRSRLPKASSWCGSSGPSCRSSSPLSRTSSATRAPTGRSPRRGASPALWACRGMGWRGFAWE